MISSAISTSNPGILELLFFNVHVDDQIARARGTADDQNGNVADDTRSFRSG